MPRDAITNNDAIDTIFGNLDLDPKDFGMGKGGQDNEPDDDDGDHDANGDGGLGGEEADDGDDEPEDFSSDDDEGDDDDVVSHNREDDDDQDQQRGRRQDDQDDGFLPRAKLDRKGNIVDPKTGKVLAPAGAAARLYRKAYRAERTVQHLDRTRQDLGRRLEKAIEIGTGLADRLDALEREGTGIPAARDLGLNNTEQLEALQLFHLGKTNPTELLKKILTRAAVQGIDVKTLGLQGGIDAKALSETILSEIRKDLKPVQDLTAAQRKQQDDAAALTERTKAVTEELENFFTANPAAQRFMPIFLKVYENPRFAKMPVTEAWARIQLNLMRRSRQQQHNPQNQRSRPNGRRRGGNGGGDAPRNVMADLDKSYDQLLREVMAKEMPRRRG